MPRPRGLRIGLLAIGLALLTSCDSTKFVAESSASIFERAAPALEQYWDYETVGKAFPANIIQLEAFIRIAPDNEVIVMSAIAAYIGYGNGWIEDRVEVADAEDDWKEAEHLRRRALMMYTRAWDLSKHLLRSRDELFDEALRGGPDVLEVWLDAVFDEKEDAKLLLWAGASLGARINMGMEDMDTVADLPLAKVLLNKSVQLDPDFMFMTGKMTLAILYSSQFPPDMDKAEKMFDEILKKTERRNLMIQMNMARHYAVNKGDHKLFRELLQEVLDAGDVLPEARLQNVLARRRAQRYLDRIEFFFSDLSE